MRSPESWIASALLGLAGAGVHLLVGLVVWRSESRGPAFMLRFFGTTLVCAPGRALAEVVGRTRLRVETSTHFVIAIGLSAALSGAACGALHYLASSFA